MEEIEKKESIVRRIGKTRRVIGDILIVLVAACNDGLMDRSSLDMDAIDWYSIENLLREKAREQNNQLN